MASYDRKFSILQPSLDRLTRKPLEVANTALLNPNSTSPLALIDGEIVQLNSSYQWTRGSDATKPGFFCIEDRGDYGVQASRKLSAIMGGGGFEADTIVYDTALTTLGAAVGQGTVNNSLSGSVARWGLVAAGGNIVIGYVTRLAAQNGNLLRFFCTFC